MAADFVCCVGSVRQRVPIATDIIELRTGAASVIAADVCVPINASYASVSAPTARTWTRHPQLTSFAVALLFLPCAMVEAMPPHHRYDANRQLGVDASLPNRLVVSAPVEDEDDALLQVCIARQLCLSANARLCRPCTR